MQENLFTEVQRFKTWWVWAGLAAINGLFIYAIIQQVIIRIPFGNRPAPDGVLIILSLFFLTLLFLLFSIKLETRITDNGIDYRFFPFQRKETAIAWHELNDAYLRQYNSLLEYGGWGIRYSMGKRGKAINTSASSNRGLQLQFKNGKLLLIGTAKPDELELVIKKMIAMGKINKQV